MICSFRWHASRIEVVTVPVEHLCGEEMDHTGQHRCECGATTFEGVDPPGLSPYE